MAEIDPIFTGKIKGRMTPQVGDRLTVAPYGIDTMVRPYICLKSDVEVLVPAKGSPDKEFSKMYAASYEREGMEGLLARVDVTFKGFKSGAFPAPQRIPSASIGQLSKTSSDEDPEDQRVWNIQFYSPVMTYRYFSDGIPTGPKYANFAGGPVAGPSIQFQTITDGNGRPRGSTSDIQLFVVAEIYSFGANPVEGTNLYECLESWRGVFQ